LEARWIESVEQFLGQGRPILVHKSDRRIVHFGRGPRRLNVNRQGERVDDEYDHHDIAQQTAKLLEPKPKDVQQRLHRYLSCSFRPATLMAKRIGMQQIIKMISDIIRPGPSPLVNAPKLECM